MSKINSNWEPSHHSSLDTAISDLYEETKALVREELKDVLFLCQAADSWKSDSLDNYYLINVHFIFKSYKHVSINLSAVPMEVEHITAEVLVNTYNDLYKLFLNPDVEIVQVTDGGSNLVKAATDCGHKRLHCNSHVLHLIIEEELESLH